MNDTDTDSEIRQLIKKMKIESPGADFTSRVMDGIVAHKIPESVGKPAPFLGKSFWILSSLFLVLIAVFTSVWVISLPGSANPGTGFHGIPIPDLTPVFQLFARIATCFRLVPESVGLTLLAATLLILGDQIFSTKGKIMDIKGL